MKLFQGRQAHHRLVRHHRHPATVPVRHHPVRVAQALMTQARNLIIHFCFKTDNFISLSDSKY